MKTASWICLIVSVLFLIIGIWQCVHWKDQLTIVLAALFLFPAIAFFVDHIILRFFKHDLVLLLSFCLDAFAFLVWCVVTLSASIWITGNTVVTDPARYEEILSKWARGSNSLVHHFPRTIPSYASNVRFSFLPGLLQAAAHIQLRFSAPPDVIAKLYVEFSRTRTMSFVGDDPLVHEKMDNGMPTTYFYTSDMGYEKPNSDPPSFPSDYEVMILDKLIKKEDQTGWNHGRTHGVAISRDRNEIVYWAESW